MRNGLRRWVMLGVLLLAVAPVWGQVASAQRALEKDRFEKARQRLEKRLRRQPDAAAYLLLSAYYLRTDTAQSVPDSARWAVDNSFDLVRTDTTGRQLRWLRRIGADTTTLRQQSQYVDSMAFAWAQQVATVEAYTHFLGKYPDAAQRPRARQMQHALAFEVARQQNTYEAYRSFLECFPDARQVQEAQAIAELRLFEAQTATNRLEEYELFVQTYPQNPYADRAVRRIFEIYTEPHTATAYARFGAAYPQSEWATVARAWQRVLSGAAPERPVLAPVLRYNRLGLMNQDGVLVTRPVYDSLPTPYRCGVWPDDHLVAYRNGQPTLLGRDGRQVHWSGTGSLQGLVGGLLRHQTAEGTGLLHSETGKVLLPPRYTSIHYLGEGLLRLGEGERCRLATVGGALLSEAQFDDLEVEEGCVVFLREGKYGLLRRDQVRLGLEERMPLPEWRYDEVLPVPDRGFLVRTGERWGALSRQLRVLIAVTADQIRVHPGGWLVERGQRVYPYDLAGQLLLTAGAEEVMVGTNGYGVREANGWRLLDTLGRDRTAQTYDSLRVLAGQVWLAYAEGKTTGFFGSEPPVEMSAYRDYEVITNRNARPAGVALAYRLLAADRQQRWALFDPAKSRPLLPPAYDRISLLGHERLLLERQGRRGVADLDGQIRLPLQTQDVGYADGRVIVVRQQRFGLYDPVENFTLAPQWDAPPQEFDATALLFLVQQRGRYGLADRKGQLQLPCQYESVYAWQDTAVFVQKDQRWYLRSLLSSTEWEPAYTAIVPLRRTAQEQWLRVFDGTSYGLLSSRRGTLIPVQYDRLRVLESDAEALFIAVRYAEDGTYHAHYYDPNGKLLRQEVFSERQYEQVVCD